MEWQIYVHAVVALLVIVNPIGAVPVFLSLTEDETPPRRRAIGRMATLAVVATLVVVALGGEATLRFFGISLASFRVGGGVVIMLMAVAMLHARRSAMHQTPEEAAEAAEMEEVAVVPLAIPLLAGPGAITTVIVAAHNARGAGDMALLGAAILTLGLSLWLAFTFAERIGDWLGRTGINIATRIMGLILIAIAVEFMAKGLAGLFPVLKGA